MKKFTLTDRHDSISFLGKDTIGDFIIALLAYKRKPYCCGAHADCPTAELPDSLPSELGWGELLEQQDGRQHLSDHMKCHGFLPSGDVDIKVESHHVVKTLEVSSD